MSTNPAAERIGQGLSKLALAMRHDAWRTAGPRGLTPTQAQILVDLALRMDSPGINDMADALAVTAATASDAVATLVEKGLVRKTKQGRSVALDLTDAGRRLADELAGWPTFLTQTIDALDDNERAVMLRSLMKMIRALQEQGRIPVQRMCVECRFFQPHAYHDSQRPHHCHFVDAPFGDAELLLHCPDQQPVETERREPLYQLFVHGQPAADESGDHHSASESEAKGVSR